MEDKEKLGHRSHAIIMILEKWRSRGAKLAVSVTPEVEMLGGTNGPTFFPPGMNECIAFFVLLVVLKEGKTEADVVVNPDTAAV